MKERFIAGVARPWYREPWPWLLMAGPVAVILAGGVTVWLALRTPVSMVDDDYYKQGLAVNQRQQRDHAAAEMGIDASLMLGDDRRSVRLRLHSRKDAAIDAVVLRLTHPTLGGMDQKLPMRASQPGWFEGRLERPLSGRWQVSIEDAKGAWRLTADWDSREASLEIAPPNEQGSPALPTAGRSL